MKKVIIIGAGPAGITAGYELLKRSKGVCQVKCVSSFLHLFPQLSAV